MLLGGMVKLMTESFSRMCICLWRMGSAAGRCEPKGNIGLNYCHSASLRAGLSYQLFSNLSKASLSTCWKYPIECNKN